MILFQMNSMNKDGLKPNALKVDGGMVANNWFSQFLSDIINLKVTRPKILETTALGVALFAGYQAGEFKSLTQIKNIWKKDRIFYPKLKQLHKHHHQIDNLYLLYEQMLGYEEDNDHLHMQF